MLSFGSSSHPTSQSRPASRPHSKSAMAVESSLYDGPSPPPYSTLQSPRHGPPHEPNAPPSGRESVQDLLASKINTIIQHNRLQSFYPPARLHDVMQRLAAVDFDQVAIKWRLPKDKVYDLAPLALYDVVFFCDDSGSMVFEDDGSRIDELKAILAKVADVATLFDDDGITVCFMNQDGRGGDAIRSASEAIALVDGNMFDGTTPLGTNLHARVIAPMVLRPAVACRLQKPVLVICITDGEPTEPRDVFAHVIGYAKQLLGKTPFGSGALAVQIAQVGRDKRAQQFLEALDKDPVVGGMIDCTSYYEMEQEEYARRGLKLTPDQWILKMCVGAIDPAYDAKDE